MNNLSQGSSTVVDHRKSKFKAVKGGLYPARLKQKNQKTRRQTVQRLFFSSQRFFKTNHKPKLTIMSSPQFCLLCKRNVIPTKSFHGIVFIILLFLGIIPGIVYLFYYASKARKCPICKSKSFGPATAEAMGV